MPGPSGRDRTLARAYLADLGIRSFAGTLDTVRRRVLVACALAVLLCAGCGGTIRPRAPPRPVHRCPPAPRPRRSRGRSVGPRPVTGSLPPSASRPRSRNPTWVDHLLLLHVPVPDGVMPLSIKELSSWSRDPRRTSDRSRRRWASPATSRTWVRAPTRPTDGSVVVRKDWKVLLVDDPKLPPQFGVPPTSSTVCRGDRRRPHPRLLGGRLTDRSRSAEPVSAPSARR